MSAEYSSEVHRWVRRALVYDGLSKEALLSKIRAMEAQEFPHPYIEQLSGMRLYFDDLKAAVRQAAD